MNLLLDTCVVLRWLDPGLGNLSAMVKNAIENLDNRVIVSAVSIWEISIKYPLGKIDFSDNLLPFSEHFWPALEGQKFHNIHITHADARAVANLHFDRQHRDPFDRLLIAQTKHRDLTLVTTDDQILDRQQQYNVSLLGA